MTNTETKQLVERAEEIARVTSQEFETVLRDKIFNILQLAVKHHKLPIVFKFNLEAMDSGFVRMTKPKLTAKAPEGIVVEGEEKEFDFNTPDMFDAKKEK